MSVDETTNIRDFLLTIVSFLLNHNRAKDAGIMMEAAFELFPHDALVLRTLAYVRLRSGDARASLMAFDELKRRQDIRAWHPLMKALYGMALSSNGRAIEASGLLTSLAAVRLLREDESS